ncbi:MAG: hypothetical protein EPN91_04765 [Salinibacterium sp.]|nr:MAG: hypothetical protein EPN91_04765 [Salinibacterium sp.]
MEAICEAGQQAVFTEPPPPPPPPALARFEALTLPPPPPPPPPMTVAHTARAPEGIVQVEPVSANS